MEKFAGVFILRVRARGEFIHVTVGPDWSRLLPVGSVCGALS